jgi:hypothetical protein
LSVVERKQFSELIEALDFNAKLQSASLTIRTYRDQDKVWEYDDASRSIKFQKELDLNTQFFNVYNPSRITTCLSGERVGKLITAPDWKEFFLSKMSYKYLVPDIGFISSRYCSKLLSHILGPTLKNLIFAVPRLAMLEIEKMGYNTETGVQSSSIDRSKAFYAMNEINFLKANTEFTLFPPLDVSLMASFSSIDEGGHSGVWIRKEIADATGKFKQRAIEFRNNVIVLLTCDPISSFAAEAEELGTCYFGTTSEETGIISFSDQAQLFDFILDTSMVYDNVRIDFCAGDKVFRSYGVEVVSGNLLAPDFVLGGLRMVKL